MKKVRKICCRITPRRIMGAVLVAASIVNLIIVGTAFAVSSSAIPTITVTWTTDPLTMTYAAPTATIGSQIPITLQPPLEPTQTPTWTATFTSTSTPTETATSTSTDTPSPTATTCTPWYWWPVYIVQGGDTLYSIGIVTDSSPDMLMLANCLPDSRIYKGQRLYVPRLPIRLTDTYTPAPNIPTEFRDVSVCLANSTVVFSVAPYDPEGISTITASYRIDTSPQQGNISMQSDGDTYYGAQTQSGNASTSTIYYSFVATDNTGDVTPSIEFSSPLISCGRG